MMEQTVIYFGDAVKALDDAGTVGGLGIRFRQEQERDLTGEYFTGKTYLGRGDGDGVDVLFHHGIPVSKQLKAYADHIFSNPVKTEKQDLGLWVETVLDQSNEYERKVFELVKAGKLGWSSGSTNRVVRKSADGEILRWPIVEFSLTHKPAEPLNRAIAIKAVDWFPELFSDESEVKTYSIDALDELIPESLRAGLRFEQRLDIVLAAVEEVTTHAKQIHEMRQSQKAGRKISAARMTKLKEIMGQLNGLLAEVEDEPGDKPVEGKSIQLIDATSLVAGFEALKFARIKARH